jgi:hypothetical protein
MSIVAAARWARNDDDLAEATDAAKQFITRIDLWRRNVDALVALVTELRRGGKRTALDRTKVGDSARALVDEIVSDGLDQLEDLELMGRLALETQWYREFSETWELREALVAAGGEIAAQADAVNLAALAKRAGRFSRRSPEEQESLRRSLARRSKRLEDLRRQSNNDPTTPEIDAVTVPRPPTEAEARISSLPSASDRLFEKDPDLGLTLAAASAGPALDPPPGWEDGSPVQARTPALRPATATDEVLSRTGRVRTSIRMRLRSLPRRIRDGYLRSKLLWRLRLTDLFVSGAVLLASSIVYTATVYNDEWGSLTDWITAFGAGFVGNVAVQWGLLPIFQTIRLRAAGTSGEAPSAST